MSAQEIISNTPKDLTEFKGQFIVFFSDDTEPKVLFSSFVAEEAYKKAEEIKSETGRGPIVIMVQENVADNISQILAMRF